MSVGLATLMTLELTRAWRAGSLPHHRHHSALTFHKLICLSTIQIAFFSVDDEQVINDLGWAPDDLRIGKYSQEQSGTLAFQPNPIDNHEIRIVPDPIP